MSRFTQIAKSTGKALGKGAGITLSVLAQMGEAMEEQRKPRFVIEEVPVLFGSYVYKLRRFDPTTGEFTDINTYTNREAAETARDALVG